MKRCHTPHCRNEAKRGRFCSTCVSRKYRQKYPLKASFRAWRDNAKRRGKDFDITFDQFKDFAIKTDYYKKRGIRSHSLHLDRIDEKKGYTLDNLQVLPNRANIRKYLRYHYDMERKKMEFGTQVIKTSVQTDTPF
jgi:hypothetical protein